MVPSGTGDRCVSFRMELEYTELFAAAHKSIVLAMIHHLLVRGLQVPKKNWYPVFVSRIVISEVTIPEFVPAVDRYQGTSSWYCCIDHRMEWKVIRLRWNKGHVRPITLLEGTNGEYWCTSAVQCNGVKRGWVFSITLRPLYSWKRNAVPILPEAWCARGLE